MKKFDFSDLNLEELKAVRANLDNQIVTYEERQQEEALKAAEEAVKQYGFDLKKLVNKKSRKRTSVPSTPKYANPENPTQTWSGKGRKPYWLTEILATGKELDDLKI